MSVGGLTIAPAEMGPDQIPRQWDELLQADPAADFFHTPTWLNTAQASNRGLEPLWLTARQGDRLLGGLAAVRRLAKVPLLGSVEYLESNLEGTSGGPVIRGDLPAELQDQVFLALVEEFLSRRQCNLVRCSVSLNTRHEERFGRLLQGDPRWRRREVPGAVIDVSAGLEAVEKSKLTNNKRNERNRGLKRGAGFFITNEARWLREYYPIYETASERWGTAPVSLEFLLNLLATGPEHAFFTCVTLEDRVVGGHLNLVFGDRVIAWNGVTDPAVARTHFPGTLVFWGDIVEACARGARQLDLGASGGVVSLEGFKKYFGADLESRGFYVNESGGMKLLRSTRGWLNHLKSFISPDRSPGRWHDGPAQGKQGTGSSGKAGNS
jgi:hypothetical protein